MDFILGVLYFVSVKTQSDDCCELFGIFSWKFVQFVNSIVLCKFRGLVDESYDLLISRIVFASLYD